MKAIRPPRKGDQRDWDRWTIEVSEMLSGSDSTLAETEARPQPAVQGHFNELRQKIDEVESKITHFTSRYAELMERDTSIENAIPYGRMIARFQELQEEIGELRAAMPTRYRPRLNESDLDHGGLSGLSDDDHSHYAQLPGRSTGQTLKGGTGSGEDLTLLSTNHATKGDVYVGGDGSTNRSVFESDGTLRFDGDATVWKDIMFPMAPPKTTGAGNPTLVTYNGNMRAYSFAVNDAHDFDPQENTHDAKVGSTATWHVHWLSQSNDGTDRAVKWELEFDMEPASGAIPAPTTASVEITIPAGTAVNTVFRDNITTFVIPAIARLTGARIKRIASVGTAPSVDPVLRALHFHYELDTVGSRAILTK